MSDAVPITSLYLAPQNTKSFYTRMIDVVEYEAR